MDGLECSEISVKDIDKSLFRIEAEYYKKEYISASDLLSCYQTIGNIKKEIICGPFGSNLLDTEYKNEGILVVRPFNLVDCKIENERLVYVSQDTIDKNGLKCFGKGSTLFSRVGDIKVGYASKDKFTISPNVIVATFDNINMSKYCALFFNTKYGITQIKRQLKIAAQPTISTGIISDLRLPVFSKLYKIIISVIDESEVSIQNAENCYKKATNIIDRYIDFKLEDNDVSIKLLSESFAISSRLDAEYYQPKFDNIIELLNTNETVKSLCNIYDCNFSPESNKEYKYIELANVGRVGNIDNVDVYNGLDLPSRARRIVKAGQVIVSSVEGSLDSCALITEDLDGALCSTGFYVIDSDRINPETLFVLFKSEVIQALLKQRCSGTILTAITKEEFLNMPLPIIDDAIQKEIASRVQESFALRKKSKQLLEYAKQAVEIAIEQDEEAAIKWLNEKVN